MKRTSIKFLIFSPTQTFDFNLPVDTEYKKIQFHTLDKLFYSFFIVTLLLVWCFMLKYLVRKGDRTSYISVTD